MSPSRLSIFVAAIFSSAPLQSFNCPVNASHSETPSSFVAFRPSSNLFKSFTCCLPPSAASAAFRSSSDKFLVASLTTFRVFCRPMKLPFESNADIPSFFIIFPAWPVPVVRFAMIALKACPASPPFLPRFAMTPSAAADSSIGTPRSFIVPPTFKYASISCSAD